MNTTKAIYWIALATFALAFNSEYRTGNFLSLHRAADRAESVVCRAATRAEQTLAMAGILTNRPRTEFLIDEQILARQQAQVERVLAEHQTDLNRVMSLRQVDLDRVQQKLDRMQQVLERTQFKRVRVLERSRFKLSKAANRRMIVVCPKTGEKISIEADTDASDMDNAPSAIE